MYNINLQVHHYFVSENGQPFVCIYLFKTKVREQRKIAYIYRRQLRDAQNPLELSEAHFQRLFRVSRQLARDIYCAPLENERSHGLPVHIQVSVLIYESSSKVN